MDSRRMTMVLAETIASLVATAPVCGEKMYDEESLGCPMLWSGVSVKVFVLLSYCNSLIHLYLSNHVHPKNSVSN